MVQSAVWSFVVVVLTPCFDLLARILQRQELAFVQTLRSAAIIDDSMIALSVDVPGRLKSSIIPLL